MFKSNLPVMKADVDAEAVQFHKGRPFALDTIECEGHTYLRVTVLNLDGIEFMDQPALSTFAGAALYNTGHGIKSASHVFFGASTGSVWFA